MNYLLKTYIFEHNYLLNAEEYNVLYLYTHFLCVIDLFSYVRGVKWVFAVVVKRKILHKFKYAGEILKTNFK